MIITFYIKESSNENYVYINVMYNYNRIRMTTGISVHKNAEIIKNRVSKKDTKSKDKNIILDNLESEIQKFYNTKVMSGGILTVDELRDRIKVLTGKKENTNIRAGFWDVYNVFVVARETGLELTPQGNKFSSGTIAHYKVVRNNLIQFEKSARLKIDFANFDDSLVKKYNAYLIKNEKSKNMIGQQFKVLKAFLKWAQANKYTDAIPKIKVSREETDAVYISRDELNVLMNTSYRAGLEKVRDLFVLHCQLGLRVTDFMNLKAENIDVENRIINTVIRKSGKVEKLTIPISSLAYQILTKYNNAIPQVASAYYNRKIKEVCQIAGIDQMVEKNITRGGRRETELRPKYELISSHTARRSFITIGLTLGLQPELIMKITGHTDHRTFQKYVRYTKKDVIDVFNEKWG